MVSFFYPPPQKTMWRIKPFRSLGEGGYLGVDRNTPLGYPSRAMNLSVETLLFFGALVLCPLLHMWMMRDGRHKH